MTTPGGVPNLPVGALTIDTLQSKTQDTSVAANRTRSGERVPNIFNASNGGSPLNDLTPFGVLTQLFSGFNSVVSQADPADINGPDDLPSLLMQFIEELPVVGQFVDLLAAFSGTYDGDDQTLLTIQHIVSLFIGADSPLNAANLYGQFGIPITWLNNNAAQALWNPGFDGPESIVGNKFQWDGTVYRTLSADHQPGSVRITADGAVHALRSNAYSLKAGDKLDDISVRVAWYGLSGTAGAKPMQISLLVLDDTGTQYVDIASAGMSDGVAASGWTGLPGGALGATLTGDWTATTDCTVVLRLVLDETASAGDIWWDAASMPVIGNGIPTEWLNALVADFAKMQAPFKTIDTFFDNTQWAIAWEGLLDILGLEQTDNQIIVNRNSIWTKLFQQVIPTGTLNLHPDMNAVNDELAIIFNPFDNNDLDRAQAWDDLMGLVGIESHTADSVAWWNNLFAANKTALADQSGVTDLADDTRRSINWMLGQLGFGYLNTSWVWVSGTPGAGDLPTSGWTNPGGAPPAWLADILKAIGVPVGNDLPSQLDPTIPAAPVLGWPVGGGSTTSTSVPQNTNLYYIATVVDTATLKESAPSNEVMIWSMPAIFGSKNQVTISWFTAPPAGKTISLYRRQSTTGQYRRVASGLTGTSTIDTDPSSTTTTQPGSAAASVAAVINDIGGTASTAQSAAAVADSKATTAAAKFNAIPEANIVVQNVDPQVVVEDWGAVLLPIPAGSNTIISGTATPNYSGPDSGRMNQTVNSVRLSLPPNFEAKTVLIFMTYAFNRAVDYDATPTVYSPTTTGGGFALASYIQSGGGGGGGPGPARGCAVFQSGVVDTGSSRKDVYVGVASTSTNQRVYALDAWMVALDGTTYGDLDITTQLSPITSIDAEADSVAIVHNSIISNANIDPISMSVTSPTMSMSHSAAMPTSAGLTGTYSLYDMSLTKNIDNAETLTIATSPDPSSRYWHVGVGVIVKPYAQPQSDTLGSHADISTAGSGGYTSTVGSYEPFTAFVETVRTSADIVISNATASFTVEYIGTYGVSVDLLCNETHDATLAIMVNGTIVAVRRCVGYSLDISSLVYAKQGDVISLQLKNNAAGNFTFDTASRMAITLVNRSYL